jgi:hypothetical protein
MAWISDGASGPYIQFAESALTNAGQFNTFKRQTAWNTVVGVGDHWHAIHCAKTVLATPAVSASLQAFLKNDTIGSPPTIKLVPHGRVAFDTLRFAESVTYLYKTFGDLNQRRITELGSNYGGLAFCILTQWPGVSAYHMLDLPQIQTFSREYHRRLEFEHSAISYEEPTEAPDIFVSELCLSEQTEDALYPMYEKYCKDANGFLMRINFAKKERENAFLKVLKETFSIEVTPEPITRIPNVLVVGRRK